MEIKLKKEKKMGKEKAKTVCLIKIIVYFIRN